MKASDKYFIALLSLSACVEGEPTEVDEAVSHITVSDSCPGRRYVGMVPVGSACPVRVAGEWVGGKLFGTAPAELEQYCVYDWNASGAPTPATLPRYNPAVPPNAYLEPDCVLLTAFGHPHEEDAASKLVPSFFEQIQSLPTLPDAVPMPTASKVVIVDSAVDLGFPAPSTGFYEHGRMMGILVRQLGCPALGGPCLANVSSQLALPLRKTSTGLVRNEAQGGTLGGFGDLATSIRDGVDYAIAQPGDDRVVVNLSLGWPRYIGGAFSGNSWGTLPAPIRAVYSAIVYASCRNAVIIAAAGNSPEGGSNTPGAAFPAGWEEKPAPDANRCVRLGGSIQTASNQPYRPLLYAASGVDWVDQLLVGTRSGGVAQLVAPAAHTAFSNPGQDTHVYVGSSIAAADFSAVLAATWAYLPTWSPHDVADLVIDNGYPMSFAPDFCLGSSCRPVARRLSMCRAIAAACSAAGNCTNPPVCTARPAGTDSRATGIDFSTPAPEVFLSAAQLPEYFGPTPADEYTTQYSNPLPYPQPPTPTCPVCTLRVNETLAMGLDKEPADVLSKPTLKVVVNGVEKKYELPISDFDLNNRETLEVQNLPFTVEDVSKGSIEFLLNGSMAISDQLFIEKP